MKQQKAPAKRAKNPRSDTFTFSDHVRELRRRVTWVALVFLVVSSAAYSYRDQLVQIVMTPLHGEKLVYLTPGGGFAFIFQITLYAGIIAAAPMFMYQLYKFVRPTLPTYAKRSAVSVACLAILLMVTGVAYGYFLAIPAALNFLSTFAGAEIIPNLTADSYLTFFLSYVGGLALLFQLPLLLIFWHWIHPMKPGGLLKSERFMIVFAFIAAAMITPTPDIMNQAMIAIPLIVIYQIGVVTVLVSLWKKSRQKAAAAQVVPSPHAAAAPVPQPVVPAAPRPTTQQPLYPATPIMQPRTPIRRSIDGFGSSTHPVQQPRPAVRHLTVPSRTTTSRTPMLQRTHAMRIDGMSPL
jgi:sec-independent protein translocase protein TatC